MGGTMKNNKKLANKSIIICILIILTIPTIASIVSAWDDCPFGEVNDAYPGDCGIYVDTDGDGICDLSQLAPEDRDGQQEAKESAVGRIDYFFIHIMFILITFYFVSLLISKKKKKMRQHRKIWNILLLITFLISGIFGILLVLRINYGIEIPLYSDLLFWHVEFGIAMTIISIFHITWHWKYFKNMIPKKKVQIKKLIKQFTNFSVVTKVEDISDNYCYLNKFERSICNIGKCSMILCMNI